MTRPYNRARSLRDRAGRGGVSPAAGEWLSIQYLRAFAATLVVVYHCGLQASRLGYAGPWPVWPAQGVDIFFIISGALMWLTTSGRDVAPVAFLRRRAARIVPLYYLLTTLVVIVMVTAPSVVSSGHVDVTHILASYAFWPYPHPVLGTAAPVLIPGWTLNYEVYFYVLFGIALAMPERWRIGATVALLLVPIGLGASLGGGGVAEDFFGSSIVLEFGLGLGLGAAVAGGRWASWAVGWAMALAGAAALLALPPDLPRILGSGLPALAIVAGAMTLEHHGHLPRVPLLRRLGDASYSLYLSHVIVLSAAGQVARLLGFDRHVWGVPSLVLGGVAASQIVALLLYEGVERPLLAAMTKWFRPVPSMPRRA